MMTNLFTIFDPTSYLLTNWIQGFVVMIFLPNPFWMVSNRSHFFILSGLKTFIYRECKSELFGTSVFNVLMYTSLFFFILVTNMTGLFPYIFTSSTHLVLTLGLALSIWLCYTMINLKASPFDYLSHLTPPGTPMALASLMVLIESVSLVIRPLTLAVRLMANMMAGHLLMCLMGGAVTTLVSAYSFLTVPAMTALITLETMVSVVQAYVFTVLIVLYSN